jgi:hypothetical protein
VFGNFSNGGLRLQLVASVKVHCQVAKAREQPGRVQRLPDGL